MVTQLPISRFPEKSSNLLKALYFLSAFVCYEMTGQNITEWLLIGHGPGHNRYFIW